MHRKIEISKHGDRWLVVVSSGTTTKREFEYEDAALSWATEQCFKFRLEERATQH